MDSANNENQFGSSTMSTECQTEPCITIEEVIARRSDLSTFIVHLTRDENSETAKDRLESIIESCTIEARTMHGAAVARFKELDEKEGVIVTPADKESQKVVCFTETPLDYLHLLTKNIEKRAFQLRPYGVAITKTLARRGGANPVWYIDMTIGHDWLTKPINELIDTEIRSGKFLDSHIAKIAPFIEQMWPGPPPKEFSWEREWRHKGDFKLPNHVLIICPEADKSTFEEIVNDANPLSAESNGNRLSAEYIDATWGLEQVIAKLAGF